MIFGGLYDRSDGKGVAVAQRIKYSVSDKLYEQ